MTGTGWQEDAACIGMNPNLWFVAKGESTLPARMICAGCPVKAECLEGALARREQYGVFGGLTERQRRSLIGPRGTLPVRRACVICTTEFETVPTAGRGVQFCSDGCRKIRRAETEKQSRQRVAKRRLAA